MKKIFLLSMLFIFGVTGVSNAQLQEGNFMLGADLGSGLTSTTSNGLFGFNLGLNDGARITILELAPKQGIF
ncbi:hypothetical protein LZ575_10320 [Antarcticibacterium sp. 1MA-6-2]|uniref:hypothetical protein n=1 Tax=Antarcticibacterium sp. 1MA-6-2 TaxID=2908210 RepID=UPI001F1623FD|nr:hypothetical protein [Antarcticibacterium sp. 1MA-6-2]UJH92781.1 hypothetical protein LZ575_10320 [Antarcticibacterium sp. 1MA-6-2]